MRSVLFVMLHIFVLKIIVRYSELVHLNDSFESSHCSVFLELQHSILHYNFCSKTAFYYFADKCYDKDNQMLSLIPLCIRLSLTPREFNSYGARRGNDAVMTRGTFASIKLQNRLIGKTGPRTLHIPSGQTVSVQTEPV